MKIGRGRQRGVVKKLLSSLNRISTESNKVSTSTLSILMIRGSVQIKKRNKAKIFRAYFSKYLLYHQNHGVSRNPTTFFATI